MFEGSRTEEGVYLRGERGVEGELGNEVLDLIKLELLKRRFRLIFADFFMGFLQ